MTISIAKGVWPTMVTPFTSSDTVDYGALETLVEWYIANNVHGLFAVCQSSEMFALTAQERIELARFIVKQADGRIPVIACGNLSDAASGQIEESRRMADTGVDAVVLISNRLASQTGTESEWQRNAERLLSALPDVRFGLYECPYPYKRLLSPDLLAWCASSGQFLFLKDTSCDTAQMEAKLRAVEGTNLRIYNANTATLLDSFQLGVSGFSGVMANFHPDLYVWLWENWASRPDAAAHLQHFLSMASMYERQMYPLNAKYYLSLEGVRMAVRSRIHANEELARSHLQELNHLYRVTERHREEVKA